jgi:intein/homing endonuclease
LQGCLATGSRVLLSSGKEKAIEEFSGNSSEEVLSNKGKCPVVGKTIGAEMRPMVFIRSEAGNTLLLSERHPVITDKGPKPAYMLEAGDVVLTNTGSTKLKEVSEQYYNGQVWNLKLATDKKDREKYSAFYANGFLVGDAAMQQLNWEKTKKTPSTREEVLAALPTRWQQDYLNYLTRKKN